jgi:hypothetical protein
MVLVCQSIERFGSSLVLIASAEVTWLFAEWVSKRGVSGAWGERLVARPRRRSGGAGCVENSKREKSNLTPPYVSRFRWMQRGACCEECRCCMRMEICEIVCIPRAYLGKRGVPSTRANWNAEVM